MNTTGQLVRQHSWTDADRARVIAAASSGMTVSQAARATGVPRITCYRWITAAQQVDADPMIRNGWTGIVLRAQALQDRVLDILEESDDATVLKHAVALNIYAGTGTDKLQKVEEPRPNPTLVIVIPGIEQVPTIETSPLG